MVEPTAAEGLDELDRGNEALAGKAYLIGSDSGIAPRTWQQANESLMATKQTENQKGLRTAAKNGRHAISSLTALNAAQLTGVVPSATLTGMLPLEVLPASVIINSETGVSLSGTISGDGTGLTALNAATLTGSVPPATLISIPAENPTGTVAGTTLSTKVACGRVAIPLTAPIFSGAMFAWAMP